MLLTPTSPPDFFFFFNDTATTEIYTLSLHDALPILRIVAARVKEVADVVRLKNLKEPVHVARCVFRFFLDRKSTRLNSSHGYISYAVFCLKKKKAPAAPVPSPTRRRAQARMPVSAGY